LVSLIWLFSDIFFKDLGLVNPDKTIQIMKNNKILVIGSSNTDMVVKTPKLPLPGETILGGEFLMNPGGKGANQAVAAARLEGNVIFIAKVGKDIFGEEAVQGFNKEGIDTQYITADKEKPSGVALIMVDDHGENCISVASGANLSLTAEDVVAALKKVGEIDTILLQLEIPLETVIQASITSIDMGARVIVNPAPAQELPDELLKAVNIITPNETEAKILTGVDVTDVETAGEAANILHEKGVEVVIITMGSSGAFISDGNVKELIAPPAVKAIDTTAAGDTFNGALAVALTEGQSVKMAVEFANKAAAISVTRMGAQASTPYRNEM
jgi:ribokinase